MRILWLLTGLVVLTEWINWNDRLDWLIGMIVTELTTLITTLTGCAGRTEWPDGGE